MILVVKLFDVKYFTNCITVLFSLANRDYFTNNHNNFIRSLDEETVQSVHSSTEI